MSENKTTLDITICGKNEWLSKLHTLSALNTLVDNYTIMEAKEHPGRVVLRMMDPSHVALANVSIKAKACLTGVKLSGRLDILVKAMKTVKVKKDMTAKIYLSSSLYDDNTTKHTTLNLDVWHGSTLVDSMKLECSIDQITTPDLTPLPNVDFDLELILESDDFKTTLKQAHTVAEYVSFSDLNDMDITITAKGDNGKRSILQDCQKLECTGNPKGDIMTCSLEYLEPVIKHAPYISDKLYVSLVYNKPIRVTVGNALDTIVFYLAPRVEN